MEGNRSVNPQAIATQLFGSINWIDGDTGFMPCPGEQFHTGKNAKRDCKIMLNGAPTITCFHSSCKGMVEDANKRLRKAMGGEKFEKRIITEDERALLRKRNEERMIEKNLQEFTKYSSETIFEIFAWSPDDMWEESPVRLIGDIERDSELFLKLFNSDDVVWIGDVTDTGHPGNTDNFRQVKEWTSDRFKNFTCPSVFTPRSYSRSNANVLARRFLVIESDILTQDQICAVFKLCRRFMELRAVVYTGGKSLHGWFDYPEEATIRVLKQILPLIGCDEALFKASQPVRFPGVLRGDKYQSLLYLNS
jgi:hypothetical protein